MSWEQLVDIIRQSRADAEQNKLVQEPLCPVCRATLDVGPRGTRSCKYGDYIEA